MSCARLLYDITKQKSRAASAQLAEYGAKLKIMLASHELCTAALLYDQTIERSCVNSSSKLL